MSDELLLLDESDEMYDSKQNAASSDQRSFPIKSRLGASTGAKRSGASLKKSAKNCRFNFANYDKSDKKQPPALNRIQLVSSNASEATEDEQPEVGFAQLENIQITKTNELADESGDGDITIEVVNSSVPLAAEEEEAGKFKMVLNPTTQHLIRQLQSKVTERQLVIPKLVTTPATTMLTMNERFAAL